MEKLLSMIRKYYKNFSEILKKDSIEEIKNTSIDSTEKVVDISKTKLNIRVRIGKKYIPLSSVKKITTEINIVLNQLANNPLEVLIQNQIIGLAEVMIVDGNFGVQITEIFKNPLKDKSYYHKDNQNKLDSMVLFEAILGDTDYSIENILKLKKASIIDFKIPAGSFSKLYLDKYYIGDGEIKVYEKYLGVTFIDSKKSKEAKIPILNDDDRERFKKLILESNNDIDRQQNCKDNFSLLNKLSSDMLFAILSLEHPQIIAVTLLNLEEELAKDILNLFNIEDSYEIIIRMSKLRNIPNESLFIISKSLKRLFEGKANKEILDGLTKAKNILNLLDSQELKDYLYNISEIDEELSDVLKKGVEKNIQEWELFLTPVFVL